MEIITSWSPRAQHHPFGTSGHSYTWRKRSLQGRSRDWSLCGYLSGLRVPCLDGTANPSRSQDLESFQKSKKSFQNANSPEEWRPATQDMKGVSLFLCLYLCHMLPGPQLYSLFHSSLSPSVCRLAFLRKTPFFLHCSLGYPTYTTANIQHKLTSISQS